MSSEEKLLKSIEFIETQLRESISLEQVAAHTAVSLRQLQRFFAEMTSTTALQYLVGRRLAESCKVLIESDRRIIDVALEFQFQTHESFTRAFSREFGISPSQFKQRGMIHHPLQLRRIDKYVIRLLKEGLLGTPRFVSSPPRKVVGCRLTQPFFSKKNDVKRLDHFQSYHSKLIEIFGPDYDSKESLWVVVDTKQTNENKITHVSKHKQFIGHEVSRQEKYTKGLSCLKLPRSKYAVFLQHLPNDVPPEECEGLDLYSESYALRWSRQHLGVVNNQPVLKRVLSLTPVVQEIYIPINDDNALFNNSERSLNSDVA